MPGTIDARRGERAPSSPTGRDTGSGGGALIERARDGDVGAWSDIVEELGPRIKGYARGKGIADDEDVVQDVFLAAAHGIGRFQGDTRAFRSWIFSIAYRQIANRYRSRSREDKRLSNHPVDPDEQAPDDAIIDRETTSEAIAALHVLTEMERDVVLLRIIADLETDEVARAVGKQPGNIRVIQSRAMAKIRAELERRGYGMQREGGRS